MKVPNKKISSSEEFHFGDSLVSTSFVVFGGRLRANNIGWEATVLDGRHQCMLRDASLKWEAPVYQWRLGDISTQA